MEFFHRETLDPRKRRREPGECCDALFDVYALINAKANFYNVAKEIFGRTKGCKCKYMHIQII